MKVSMDKQKWFPIADEEKWLPITEDVVDEAKEDNDAAGREFEWKMVKYISDIKGFDFPDEEEAQSSQAKYAYGTLISDDKVIEDSANMIFAKIASRSNIKGIEHIGERNTSSHGDVLLHTKKADPNTGKTDIGIELKYVKDSQGTWHNTKGHLLNSYLNLTDELFISPKQVMKNTSINETYSANPGGLKFGGVESPIIDYINAILEPFKMNGVRLSDMEADSTGWGGVMSIDDSHLFRHELTRGDKKTKEIKMNEIFLVNRNGKWYCSVGEGKKQPLSYQSFWNGKPNTQYKITSSYAYDNIFKSIGNRTMLEVVKSHVKYLKSNTDYLNKWFKAILLKVTAKNLVSKLPDYLIAYRKATGQVKLIDCWKFRDSDIKNVQFVQSKQRKTTQQDIETLDDAGEDTGATNVMGYYLISKELDVQFKVQYYWKNGTGLANPVVIMFLQ